MGSLNVCAVVLNWRAADETIKCVDSLLRFAKHLTSIVVVDNNSEDGSYEKLQSYYLKKSGNVYVVNSDCNNGYAGGNNFGLRFALLNIKDIDYFWIVNNDAYILEDALLPMLEMVGERKIVGSLIVNSGTSRLECYGGGVLYPILGKSKLLYNGYDIKSNFTRNPDYIMGCSMLFHTKAMTEVGFLDESYFMYSEEVDWQTKALKIGYKLSVCDKSIIYHLGSMSSGGKSEFYYFYRNRAAVFYNKRFYGVFFAFISAFNLSCITLLKEIKYPKKIISGVKGAFSGLVMKDD